MEQSLDRAFVIPELISELTQQQIDTPVIHSITYLDEHRKQNLLRKWEQALVEECADMKQGELDTFVEKMKSNNTEPLCRLRCSNNPDFTKGYFKNKHIAINMLYHCAQTRPWYLQIDNNVAYFSDEQVMGFYVPNLDDCRNIVENGLRFHQNGSDAEDYFQSLDEHYVNQCDFDKMFNTVV